MTNHKRKYKIALIGDSLGGGGAEKVHALLSGFFVKNGIEVYNCIFVDNISYPYSGSLLNLGKVAPSSSAIARKWHHFFTLKRWFRKNRFDAVIDFRMHYNDVQELVFSRVLFPQNTIYTIHSGILAFYFPASGFLSRIIYRNHKVVAVSKAIMDEIYLQDLARDVAQIYNPVDIDSISILKEKASPNEKYILAVGRMNDEVKQFDKLIIAYSQSKLPEQNIKLFLLGEGKNKQTYIKLSRDLELQEYIIFEDFVQNPFPYYKNALFTVLSSSNEGFPNVIIESLATNTPVVAFDCFSGPNEIIRHRNNGLLVENQNFDKLTEAMNLMISDTDLYNNCKQNACQSIERFSLENIGRQWLHYLKIM